MASKPFYIGTHSPKMGILGKLLAIVSILVLAGVVVTILKTPEELSITNFHYCSSIYGWRNYDEHSRTYTNGEQIFMYFEVKGFKKNNDEAQIYQTLTILQPDGSPLTLNGIKLQDYPMVNQSINASGKSVLWFDNHLTIIDETWEKGEYDVIIKVEDRLANTNTTYSTNFVIA